MFVVVELVLCATGTSRGWRRPGCLYKAGELPKSDIIVPKRRFGFPEGAIPARFRSGGAGARLCPQDQPQQGEREQALVLRTVATRFCGRWRCDWASPTVALRPEKKDALSSVHATQKISFERNGFSKG